MKKLIFTAVLLTAGVVASAQTTETINNDAKKAELAVDSTASKDAAVKPEVIQQDDQVKVNDPNVTQEPQADQPKEATDQPADQPKKGKKGKKK